MWQPLKEITPDASRSRSRERSPRNLSKGHSEEFVRIINLPQECTLGDIKEFMQGIQIRPADIVVVHDINGKSLREAIIRLNSIFDLSVALGYSGRLLKDQCLTSNRFM